MRALYDSKSKLDDRGIKYLLSEENKYKTWLKVEGALALSQAKEGFIPKEAAEEIASVPFETLDLEEMEKIKAKVGHGFVPFVKVLVKACKGEGKKYVHYGVTTQNIQQTSQLYITRQVTEIYKSFLADILKNLAALARDNADAVMPGRTHGKHAIPITYGYKVSVWISELLTGLERLEEAEKRIFTDGWTVFAHQFSSIAGAGPVTGAQQKNKRRQRRHLFLPAPADSRARQRRAVSGPFTPTL